MRGLALAEIAAVDLDIAVFGWWPRRSFLSAISSKRFVAGRMPQRREDRGRGQQHRFRRIEAQGFRAAGGTHFAAYSRPLLRSPVTGGKQRGTTHAQRDPRDGGRDIDSMGDQHARTTP